MTAYVSRTKATMDDTSLYREDNTVPVQVPAYHLFFTSFSYVPSWKIFHDLVCLYLQSRDSFQTKMMQGIDGIMFKGDASHKLTKLIYVKVSEKVYHGLYTLMNEYGQIVAWIFIRTGKMEEFAECILASEETI